MAHRDKEKTTRKQPDPLLAFFKRLPLMLLAAIVLWLVLARPVLDRAIPWTTQTLIRAFEYPRVTHLPSVNHRVEVRRSDLRATSGVLSLALTEIHFNTIVLLTLFLALPRPLSRRQLERLFMGACLLFLSQSLNLLFHVKCFYATALGEWSLQHYSEFARGFYGFMKVFTDLPGKLSFPFLIWLAYNWDLVQEMLGWRTATEQPAGQATRQQPRRPGKQRSARTRKRR